MDPNMIMWIAVGAAAVLAAACLLYGAIRRFTRITWIGYQIPLVFGIVLLLNFIPATGNDMADFAIAAGGMLAAVGVVLGASKLIRNAMFSPKRGKPGGGARFCNRFFGAIGALLTLVVFLAVAGAAALKAVEVTGLGGEALSPLFENPVWSGFFSGYAADLLLISLFLIVMRAGFRLGLLKAIYYLLMFALTAGAFIGAILFSPQIGFMRDFCGAVAGWFGGMPAAAASVLGGGIVILLVFAVFFAVVMLFGALLNWLIKKVDSVRVIALIDGLIVCILYTAVFFAFTVALYYGVAALAGGALDGALNSMGEEASAFRPILDGVRAAAEGFAAFLRSSPVTAKLYDLNPLLSWIPAIGA